LDFKIKPKNGVMPAAAAHDEDDGDGIAVVRLGDHQFLDVRGLLLPIRRIRSIDLVSDPDETRVVMDDDADTTAFGGAAGAALRAFIYRSV
jgi:hypothetical protein